MEPFIRSLDEAQVPWPSQTAFRLAAVRIRNMASLLAAPLATINLAFRDTIPDEATVLHALSSLRHAPSSKPPCDRRHLDDMFEAAGLHHICSLNLLGARLSAVGIHTLHDWRSAELFQIENAFHRQGHR